MAIRSMKEIQEFKEAKSDVYFIVGIINRFRFVYADEAELRDKIYYGLPPGQCAKEVTLDEESRIDLMVGKIGIEIKIGGTGASVLRQLHRYAQSEKLTGLILVTSRAHHSFGNISEINGKPFALVSMVSRNAF